MYWTPCGAFHVGPTFKRNKNKCIHRLYVSGINAYSFYGGKITLQALTTTAEAKTIE